MTSKGEHQKHPPLKRPTIGTYHRCEWAIYGTSCKAIEDFVQGLHDGLGTDVNLAYIDADHGTPIDAARTQINELVIHQDGLEASNLFDHKARLKGVDLVLVNGNHYPASRQIVFLNEEKKDSLQRRVQHLTQIDLIIKESEDQELYDFLEGKVTEETLFLLREEQGKTLDFIKNSMNASTPALKALILAGGKSTRMGSDKSQLSYDGDVTQELKMAKLCASIGLDSYISKGADFTEDIIGGIPVIKDRLTDMGPFGAIVSAFMHDPDAAWLVMACDLPFINEASLQRLIAQRHSSGVATAFKAEGRPFPEPLITIYEPKAYGRFLEFMSLGYSCPRKVIINSDVRVIDLEDESVIQNVNTPEELEEAKNRMSQSHE
jgi:molybdopterin-guanine dinucleotide biosynthesis protein A